MSFTDFIRVLLCIDIPPLVGAVVIWFSNIESTIGAYFIKCLQKRKYYQAAKKMFKADICCSYDDLESIPKENLNEYVISYYSFLQDKKTTITTDKYVSAISGFAGSGVSTIEDDLLDLLPKANKTLCNKVEQYHKDNISFTFDSSLFGPFDLSMFMNVCLLIIELYDREIIKLKNGMSISDVNFADILLGNTKDISDILADECLKKKYREKIVKEEV